MMNPEFPQPYNYSETFTRTVFVPLGSKNDLYKALTVSLTNKNNYVID